MMRTASSLLLLLLSVPSLSQEMVKVNIIELYDKVPAPPSDVKSAFARAECKDENMTLNCTTEKFYQPTQVKIDAIMEQLSNTAKALQQPAADAMKKVDPEEVKRKFASMSQLEKVKYAMEMNKQMGLTKALVPEPAGVRDAIEEYGKLNEEMASDMQNIVEIIKKKGALREQCERRHAEINEWQGAEAKKIPWVDGGGETGGFPDPKLFHALRVKAVDKHIAAENEYLKALPAQWNELIKSEKARYTPFQQKLTAINYGEDAKNVETKRTLVTAQGLLLNPATELMKVSQDATDHAVHWWVEKLALDAQKPQY